MAEIKRFYAWIGPSNGYAAINWHASGPQSYDWVGLYADENKGWKDYLSYQWVSKTSPFVTSTIITDGLNVRCFTWVGESSSDSTKLSLDEVNAENEGVVTPVTLLASISGSYEELMRTRALNLEEEVNARGEAEIHPGCYVTCSPKGYAKLNWTAAKSQGSKDWVALYRDVYKSNDDYISGAWEWAVNNSSYVTSEAFVPGLQARYIKQGSPYIALRRSKPIAAGYVDLGNMYNVSTEKELVLAIGIDIHKILKIMTDQLNKAIKEKPSVFSPGFWPFPDNLLFKNLSFEEVKVIGRLLRPAQYYDVIMVYYETYQMAITIADGGERNAKRRAFWQISMIQKFGISFAKEIGNAHERGRPGTAEDNRVDDLNNAAALKYTLAHPGIDPATAANDMWSSGLLADYNDEVAPQHAKDEL